MAYQTLTTKDPAYRIFADDAYANVIDVTVIDVSNYVILWFD